ncbi:hypothetical protein HMJ29_10390 [Hymenobacter taeanensis]|uniref:Uncharacterized protein n=1 Tax=Hymenobacter taeanensis TaxID=2735321 RepID=A0A6M6BHQ6_9BACT|nr:MULTISPECIES: hypothetical protein [Hymenobacter]QJX47324.1 hypothetical protein HMJ29_10390 [Hymenobacter taeanensis]UOQ79339.1 hypothetical protein MUN83_10740 [Hymenobacter sp. 5414T-23]
MLVSARHPGLAQKLPAGSNGAGSTGAGSYGLDPNLEEQYHQIVRSQVQETQLWKLGLNDVDSDVRRFSYGVYLIYERKITPAFALLAELNPGSQPVFRYVNDPATMTLQRYNARYFRLGTQVAGRYYYNLSKRMQEGKSANNFSANYFSAQLGTNTSYTPFNENQHYNASTPALSARYGLQRRLGPYGFVDANLGLNLNQVVSALGNTSYIDRVLTGEFRIGLAVGK